MTTTISDGSTSISPELVTGYASTRGTRNVIHPIVNSAAPEVTLRPAGYRRGTLECLILTLAAALDLEALIAQAVTFTFADTDLPALDMTFVADGNIEVELDPETRDLWLVRIAYQEVAP